MQRYRYSFYDSQIIATALSAGAPMLYSEDMHGDQTIDGLLTIRSPFRMSAQQRTPSYAAKRRRAAQRGVR